MGIGGELGGVLTRAAQSNITAVGTTPANIAARWKFLPCFQIFSPLPFFPKKNTRSPAFLAAARAQIFYFRRKKYNRDLIHAPPVPMRSATGRRECFENWLISYQQIEKADMQIILSRWRSSRSQRGSKCFIDFAIFLCCVLSALADCIHINYYFISDISLSVG